MKIIFLILSCLYSFVGLAQERLNLPIKIEPNDSIKAVVNEELIDVYTVDFTGDNKLDFICVTRILNNPDYLKEYWLDNQYKIIKTKKVEAGDFYAWWFVNLDDDNVPELIYANGWAEGVDYGIYSQDLINGDDKLLFYFKPVLKISNNYFLCGPFDIKGMYTKNSDNKIKFLATIKHKIIRGEDGEELTYLKNQLIYPIILFKGNKPDYSIEVEKDKIIGVNWFTLEGLIKLCLK